MILKFRYAEKHPMELENRSLGLPADGEIYFMVTDCLNSDRWLLFSRCFHPATLPVMIRESALVRNGFLERCVPVYRTAAQPKRGTRAIPPGVADIFRSAIIRRIHSIRRRNNESQKSGNSFTRNLVDCNRRARAGPGIEFHAGGDHHGRRRHRRGGVDPDPALRENLFHRRGSACKDRRNNRVIVMPAPAPARQGCTLRASTPANPWIPAENTRE
jgi:hypothetical protein